MVYEERINGKTFYFYNKPSISLSQFFDDIDKLYSNFTKMQYESLIQDIRDISNDYAHLISLQVYDTICPGDILYYKPGKMYSLGHMEIVIGVGRMFGGNLAVYKSHPSSGGYDELMMEVRDDKFTETISRLHYIGPEAPLIRATASFITKIFISQKKVDYGGFCSIIFKRCSEYSNSINSERIQRLQHALKKIISSERTTAVCSGFSILMFQLAFVVHGMLKELNEAMPLNAKHCSPFTAFNILHDNANWEVTQCNSIQHWWNYTYASDNKTLLQSSSKSPDFESVLMSTVSPSLRSTVSPSLRSNVSPTLISTVSPTLRSTLSPTLRSTVSPTLKSTVSAGSIRRSTLRKRTFSKKRTLRKHTLRKKKYKGKSIKSIKKLLY